MHVQDANTADAEVCATEKRRSIMDVDIALEITDRFRKAFLFDEPCLIEGGDGNPVRVLNCGPTISMRGDWLNVSWAPFGHCDTADCLTIPKVFEGLEVRCHQEQDTPLTPEEIAIEHFANQYMGSSGTIEGGDGQPVVINVIDLASATSPEYAKKDYGCPEDDRTAILVGFALAGMEYDQSDPNELPQKKGVNPALWPDRKEWVVFPSTYEGLNIYYARGEIGFAH